MESALCVCVSLSLSVCLCVREVEFKQSSRRDEDVCCLSGLTG